MSERVAGEAADNEDYLTLLDNLIVREYRRLQTSDDKNVRMGDFLKMIELRHKLTPPGADQREFWAAMDKIRHDVLSKETTAGSGSKKAAGSGKRSRTRRRKEA